MRKSFICCFLVVFAVMIFIVTITVLAANFTNVPVSDDDDSKDKILDEENPQELFQLSIIHINDFHARFEETNERSLPCREGETCIGGFARMKTVVDRLRKTRKNSIFLDAGDIFQGTFWYNLLRYNVTSHFLNLMTADATTLGNHEFSHRVAGVVPLLQTLISPVVVANIDDRNEPTIHNLYRKSIIIERSGRKIGVIGVIFRETSSVASTDQLKFTNEATSIRNEATKLRRQGVNIIIVLSHCGIERDREIALETGDFVDVIVGGHSHSFLYTSMDETSPGPDEPVDLYPIVVTPSSGSDRKVLIVQASSYAKYVGDLRVYFNAAGHVKYYDGNPIFLGSDIEKDPEIERELIPWREEVDRLGRRVIGYMNVDLLHEGCRIGECALGSFSADAFVYETKKAFPEISVYASIIQAAGIRSSFPAGNITYGDIVALMPWENTLDVMELQGDVIMDVFEHSVSRSFVENDFIGIHMLQIAGFKVTFNVTKPVGNRLQSIEIQTNSEEGFEKINPHKLYTIIVPSFIAGGGDGFTMIKVNRKNHRVGLLDIDIVGKFIERNSPISFRTDGRIFVLT
jgi:5'-nucleotidase